MSTLKITMTGPGMGHIELDGKDISNDVRAITLDLETGRENIAVVSYHCHEVMVEGQFTVEHACGLLSLGDGE